MDRKGVSKTNLISSVLGEFLVVNRRIGQVGSRFVFRIGTSCRIVLGRQSC